MERFLGDAGVWLAGILVDMHSVPRIAEKLGLLCKSMQVRLTTHPLSARLNDAPPCPHGCTAGLKGVRTTANLVPHGSCMVILCMPMFLV